MERGKLPHSLTRKIKPLTLTLLILAYTTTALLSLHCVRAETKIISLNPTSGHVGTTVQIIANISTENGQYKLRFGQIELQGGNAVGNGVNTSFTVPHTLQGTYDVAVIDVETGESATATFTVLTSYSFEPLLPEPPIQFQQGDDVAISVKVTGGRANYEYPKIKVQTPAAGLAYEAAEKITTNDVGDFLGTFTYPTDFSNGANTNFTGEYKIFFNETVVGTFFIGLTDRSEYHRGDLVKIKAVDYSSYSNVNVTIKFGNETVATFNQSVKNGILNANWRVPNTTRVGNYVLSITPIPASKQGANDTQVFKIPGFKTEISPRNLANEAVPDVLVKIYDRSVNETYEAKSGENGVANIWLERGDYNSTAYFKGVKVGALASFNIVDEGEKIDLQCQLTNLNITVVDAQNFSVKIPFVSLSVTYSYITDLNGGERKTEPAKLYQTDITGTAQLNSMLLNAIYTVNASRYGKIFSENNTFSNLQVQAWNNIVIAYPVKSLSVNVFDAKNQPIPDAIVKAQELMGGLRYESSTNQNGQALLNCIFGVYFVKVYYRGILLNETKVNMFDDQSVTIKCVRYNLPIYVKVVDYFGQPIPNANVTLERNGLMLSSKRTEANGLVKFTEIGGTLRIKVYLADQNQPTAAFTILVDEERNETNPIEVKIGKYVILAGLLIETAQFTAIMLVAAVIILILALDVCRKRWLKLRKA
ncbi:MAG: hypothetical protein QXJ63_02325 [Candidatus Bathyarchaeia archaeon]